MRRAPGDVVMLQRGTLVVDDAFISDLSRRLNSEVRVSIDMARVEISAVIMDSRRIVEGSLFACVVGEHFDGHNFAQEAVDRGATALLVDRELPMATPQIIVDDVRSALGEVAALVSGRPSDAMKVIGVTGTNGKTTVAQMLAAVFTADGQKSAVIGTLEGDMTTPEAPVLQRRLRELHEDGVSVVAMEVSSHSLVQQRVQGTAFAAAVFTNLGRDHLDLHGTQEEYFRAKSLLFTSHGVKQMIINDDDVHGRLLGDLSSDIGDVYRFSMSDIENLQMALSGSAFVLDGTSFHVHLPGRQNVENALAVIACARAVGVTDEVIADGLESLQTVPGRMELISHDEFDALVDFAHTPEALEALLRTCREIAPSRRLVVVFGCGGGRDRLKRPDMAAVAGRCADAVIVTSDNPRNEDPDEIITEICHGFSDATTAEWSAEVDRAAAIRQAIVDAKAGDIVIIAGKGHERYQESASGKIEFDDVAHIRAAMEARR